MHNSGSRQGAQFDDVFGVLIPEFHEGADHFGDVHFVASVYIKAVNIRLQGDRLGNGRLPIPGTLRSGVS